MDAIEQSFLDPGRFIEYIKPKLGTTENLLTNGSIVTPTDATAMILETLKADVERTLGIALTEVAATCPANLRDDQKQALLESYERCGLEVLLLLPEPTSAAMAYIHLKDFSKGRMLVYDFGHGTLDVSVIEVHGPQVDVLSTDGVPQLGGRDFDACLRNRVLDEIESSTKQRPTPETDPLLFLDLRQRVEAAKISLGRQQEVPIVVSHDGKQFVVKITQAEFHQSIDHLIDKSLKSVDQAVAGAGLKMTDIDRLILVGGTSRLPYIQERVADHTGLMPHTDINPEKAIAYGAALACVAEQAKRGTTASLYGRSIPAPDMFVRDVTAHDVGCSVLDGSGSGKHLVQSVIVVKNTPTPCQKTDRFKLVDKDQTACVIEILQGPAGAKRDDCLLIGEIRLDGLPPETARTDRIVVEYVIDRNGMITATGRDAISGKSATVSVDYRKGITPSPKPRAA
jgi:molecular chaperone DnaK